MSADRTPVRHLALVACGLLGQSGALADEAPDMEFLEYLGSWDGSDEDWLIFNDVDYARDDERNDGRNDERSDPAPTGEESTESEDER